MDKLGTIGGKAMLVFLLMGIILTFGAAVLLYIGYIQQGVFVFGPFIGVLVGINFIVLTLIKLRQNWGEERDGT